MSKTATRADELTEILCQAVDTIVTARIGDLEYDKTIVCTVTDATEHERGKYIVTDGSVTFEAYGDYTNYSVNSQVQVVIPGGDWSKQKTIIGRYVVDDDAIVYRSPTSKIANLSGNLAAGYTDEYSIAASGVDSVKSDDLTAVYKVPQSFKIHKVSNKYYDKKTYDTLCIKADFRCLLDNYNITSGSYGIRVILNNTVELELDSALDMFGQVYNFIDWVPQEQAYKIPESIEIINTVEIWLYQSGDFKYLNENGEVAFEPQQRDSGSFVPTIFVKNLNIYLGNESGQQLGPEINTTGSISYTPKDESLERVVNLVWYERDADGNSIGLDENAQITWYVDNNNGDLVEDTTYGTDSKTITIKCNPRLSFTEVQARVSRLENSADNKVVYESNVLRFENQLDKTSQVPERDIKLFIVNKNNALDAYPYYGTDNKVLNKENNTPRTIQLIWSSTKDNIDKSYWIGSKIAWSIPSENTLLNASNKEIEITNENYQKEESYQFIYKIKEQYFDTSKENTITCTITLPQDKTYSDKPLQVEKTIRFSSHPVDENGKEESLKDNWDKKQTVIIQDVKDNIIGLPQDVKQDTVYDYITNQITDIEDNFSKKINSYVTGEELFNQESTFRSLTDNGKVQGIFKDENGQLYVNGSYIATGILRSQNWEGKITSLHTGNTYKNWEEVDAAITEGIEPPSNFWQISATRGTFWDLNSGQLFSKTLEINALNSSKEGIYLNSDPAVGQSWLKVGNSESFIDFDAQGNFTIQTNDKFIVNAWDNKQGIYINSKGQDDNFPYFRAGNATTLTDGRLQGKNLIEVTKDRVLIAATEFVLDAYDVEDGGIYLNSNPQQYEDGSDQYLHIGGATNNFIQLNKDKGLIANLNKITIDAFDNTSKKGIYLNSNPDEGDYWFMIGENDETANRNNFIQLDKQGNFVIQTNDIFTLNAWHNQGTKYQGVYIDSAASKNGIYFRAGSAKQDINSELDIVEAENLIQVDTDGLTIKTNNLIIDTDQFKLDPQGNASFKGDITATSLTIVNNAEIIGLKVPNKISDLENDSKFASETGVVTIINGHVDADYVSARALNVDAANVKGQLTAAKISANEITAGSNDATITFNGTFTAPNATIIGTITADYLMANSGGQIAGWTIEGNSLKSGAVGIYSLHPEIDVTIGNVTSRNWRIIAGNSFGVTREGQVSVNNIDISGGSFEMKTNNNTYIRIGNKYESFAVDTIDFKPASLSSDGIGSGERLALVPNGIQYHYGPRGAISKLIEFKFDSGYRGILHHSWYTDTAITVTSDELKKNNIEKQADVYSRIFDRFNPVTFKYNHGTSDRIHMGLIAQDVESSVIAEGITTKDFAPLCYDVDESGNKINYGIRYEELVSMCIYEIQKLKKRIAELE